VKERICVAVDNMDLVALFSHGSLFVLKIVCSDSHMACDRNDR
jgi:hypothetical protein